MDLRWLYGNILVGQFQLPKSNKMSITRQAKWFSMQDLSGADYQMVLEPSRHLATFCTPFGSNQFKRMPFGLASAATVFQRIMQLFGHLPKVTFFQDDILVMVEEQTAS